MRGGQVSYAPARPRTLLPLAVRTTLSGLTAMTTPADLDGVRCLGRLRRRERRRRRASLPRRARPEAIRDRVNLQSPRVAGHFHLRRLIMPFSLGIEVDPWIDFRLTIVPIYSTDCKQFAAVWSYKRAHLQQPTRSHVFLVWDYQTIAGKAWR